RALDTGVGRERAPPAALPAALARRPGAGARELAPHGAALAPALVSAVRVTLLPGDGIGPEVIGAARRVLEATGVALEWEVHEVGAPAVERGEEPLPEVVLESIRRNRVALKGPVATAGMPFRSVNIALRRS